ncbi:MAG TPA: class F sortase [Acidimicrobiales bacterium]|nr:class F sortase [Acidimicrobiales bacterium]
MTQHDSIGRYATVALALAAVLLAGTAITLTVTSSDATAPTATAGRGTAAAASAAAAAPVVGPKPTAALPVPAALVDSTLSLRAGPVPVPLKLQIPSISVDIPVLGVGITARNVMDAPEGPENDPVWQQAFWYRGSAVPGAASTALIAGHVDDPLGRPGAFAHIDLLRVGDLIVVHDARTGLDVRFSVTAAQTYSLAQAADPAVLTQIYGAGPVDGNGPTPSADGLAHLTLITCAGTFVNGTHDHRIVVYATRIA